MNKVPRAFGMTSIIAVTCFAVLKTMQYFRKSTKKAPWKNRTFRTWNAPEAFFYLHKDDTENAPDERVALSNTRKAGEAVDSIFDYKLEDDLEDDPEGSACHGESDSVTISGTAPAIETNHLVRRFCRFLRIAGIARYIEELTHIPRSKVFLSADSVPQNQKAKLIINPRDSLPLRIQVGPIVEQTSWEICEELRDFLRQTYVTPKSLKVDKIIEIVEESLLPVLLSIHWESMDIEGERNALKSLNTIAKVWVEFLKESIISGDCPDDEREEMENAFKFVSNMRSFDLLNQVRAGFEYMETEELSAC